MTRRTLTGVLIVSGVVALGVLSGRADLWSSSGKPMAPQAPSAQAATAAGGDADALQSAFMRIAQQVGPSVVSVSTEQIERVRQYFRSQPFLGEEPFEDFFHQFYGNVPERELHRFGLGSGVIIDARGYILTNEHVVADAEKITVTLADGREFTGTVKGKDPRSDLAVVKIDAKGLSPARLGDSESVRTGQWAVAMGNPFGLMGAGPSARALGAEPTLTVGVVSAINRQLPRMARGDRDYSDLIQTDAAINPGNSGGPLLNLQGEIIGINVAILTSSRGFEGVGFAIPVNKAKSILAALIEGKEIVYGWLGIQIQDITDDVSEYYKLADRKGVLIYQVLPNSPASKGGLKDGDIVKAVDGQPVLHSRQLIDQVSGTKAGRHVKVSVLREGKPLTLDVEIGERPSETEVAGVEATEGWRGMKVANLTEEQAKQFELPAGTAGVIVVEVEPNSAADQAGIRPGDLINEVNRAPVGNVNDYQTITAQVNGNALVRTNRGYVVIKAGG